MIGSLLVIVMLLLYSRLHFFGNLRLNNHGIFITMQVCWYSFSLYNKSWQQAWRVVAAKLSQPGKNNAFGSPFNLLQGAKWEKIIITLNSSYEQYTSLLALMGLVYAFASYWCRPVRPTVGFSSSYHDYPSLHVKGIFAMSIGQFIYIGSRFILKRRRKNG